MNVLLSTILSLLAGCGLLSAQHIREQDKAYSTSIVREINLNHPSNQRLFGKRALLGQILLEASLNGYCKVYRPDSIDKELSRQELIYNFSFSDDSCGLEQYSFSQLYMVELQEEFIFDKNRSEFRFIPKYITLFIPVEVNYRGFMQAIGTWKYEDCEKIFRTDNRAFSEVHSFGKSKINFSEIFLLRFYNSEIVKIGTDAPYFDQLHADQNKAFMMGKEKEYRLQEMMYQVFHP